MQKEAVQQPQRDYPYHYMYMLNVCWQCAHPMHLRYWILPDGRAVVLSLLELLDKNADELMDPNAWEAYHLIGKELGYQPLGMLPDTECVS